MTRPEVWLRAWCATAATFNAKVADCTRYADECLKAHDARFLTPAIEAEITRLQGGEGL